MYIIYYIIYINICITILDQRDAMLNSTVDLISLCWPSSPHTMHTMGGILTKPENLLTNLSVESFSLTNNTTSLDLTFIR